MTTFLITCCNATCAVPEAQRELFKGQEDRVTSPEGWEPGALNLAQGLAMKLSTPLVHGEVTRLLIDLEQTGDDQWSEISKQIPDGIRTRLGDRHNEKFRHVIEVKLAEDFKRYDAVIHIDVHTAPITDGSLLFEYMGAPLAKSFAANAAKLVTNPEINATSRPIEKPSAMLESMLEQEMASKIGIVRLTVSQSFFLKSQPLRWETAKKAIIHAIHQAANTANPPSNLQFDF